MKSFWTITFFFSFSILFAQPAESDLRKIDIYAYNLENSNLQLDSLSVIFDSISVKTNIYEQKLLTVSHFTNSNTDLTINYYFEDKKLILVRVNEQSPKSKDLYNYSSFYISDNKIISKKYYHNINTGMLIPSDDKEFYELYGYNKTFNSDFLEKYIFDLLDKIKTTANKRYSKCGFE